MTIEYDGSGFYGWQRQKRDVSVQATLEEAISIFTKCETRIVGAGRTDAGVHAIEQTAHFDFTPGRNTSVNTGEIGNASLALDTFRAMECINNNVQGRAVSVLNIEEVPNTFHAQRSAIRRHYFYRIINRIPKLSLNKGYALHMRSKLDITEMEKAAKNLVGTHDFSSFRGAACQSPTPIKTLYDVSFEVLGHEIKIHFIGSAFLHHQVRNMIGTLLLVGNGKISIEDFNDIINARNRAAAGPTAPSYGLYLFKVFY